MTEKEREIEEAYKELEQIWEAEFEAKSHEMEIENEKMDALIEDAYFYSDDIEDPVDENEIDCEEEYTKRVSNTKIAFAIIATKTTRWHSMGCWREKIATIIGDFIYIDDVAISLDGDSITIQLKRPYKAYYLNELFDKITIKKVSELDYHNLPFATLYLGDLEVATYRPRDWYTEYMAYDFIPNALIRTFQEVEKYEFGESMILTTDGGLYMDGGVGQEKKLSDLRCLHGLI